MTPHLLNDVLLPLLLKAAATILTALTVAAVNALRKRIRDQRVAEAFAFLTTLTAQAVMAAAEEVRTLKDPLKPGHWTDDEKRRVRDAVIGQVRETGGRAVALVRREMAAGSDEHLHALLRDITEAQVEGLRAKSLTPATGLLAARVGTLPPPPLVPPDAAVIEHAPSNAPPPDPAAHEGTPR